jgi:hypothetical protein
MIKSWLNSCKAHPKCCQTLSGGGHIDAEQAPLPTRCIEVLESGFRLSETESKIGSYLALSHRWASHTAACSTTTSNIDMRRNETSWAQDLPKIFLDTLELARRLDVKFVWIDSICIIQHEDDGDDWQRESVKMADYFQQALLTVAATSGSEDYGLVPPKVTLPPRIARLPYQDGSGSRKGFFYVYSYNKEVDRQYELFVRNSELLTLGWVFQPADPVFYARRRLFRMPREKTSQ